ncbi:DEAD/DEAH box helicase [Candidatus Margulisiibacteriota bacterium]
MKNDNPKKFGLLLEINSFEGLKIYPFDGKHKLSLYSTLIPSEIRYLMRSSFIYGSIEEDLIKYLDRQLINFPFYLKIGHELISLTWDKSLEYKKKTSLNLTGNTIKVSRIGEHKGRYLKDLYMLGDQLVVDTKKKVLARIEDSPGWETWYYFYEKYHIPLMEKDKNDKKTAKIPKKYFAVKRIKDLASSAVKVPVPVFNQLLFCCPREKTDFLVLEKTNNKELVDENVRVKNLTNELQCKIGITPDYYSGNIILEARCIVQNNTFYPSREIFDFVADQASHKQNKAEKPDNIKLLHQERYLVINNSWSRISVDPEKELSVYNIPLTIYKDNLFCLKDQPFKMFVKSSLFYKSIAELQKKLAHKNVELLFEEKPLEVMELDFDLKAEEQGTNFAINTKITSAGQELDKSIFKSIVMGEGIIFHKDNTVKVLDERSQQIVRDILNIMPLKKESKAIPKTKALIPRLQILDLLYLRKLGIRLNLEGDILKIFDRLMGFEKMDLLPIPKGLQTKLRHYQKEGFSWLSFLYQNRFGACLADDMGLGKTVQVITLLAAIKEKLVPVREGLQNRPSLIVVPPSILFNWIKEINKFFPGFKIFEYFGVDRKVKTKNYDLLLTTYDIVRRDIEKLKKHSFNIIVFDEAQVLKNYSAERTQAALQLKGEFKICLTGTPLENHIGEYFSIISIAVPGLLKEYKNSALNNQSEESLQSIIKRTKPFVLRRNKKEILSELPAKEEEEIYLTFSEKQKEIYELFLHETRKEIQKAYAQKNAGQAQILSLTSLLRLRQICLSPHLMDKRFEKDSPKIEYLTGKLKELIYEGHSALVFSQFRSFLNLICERLDQENVNFLRMDGSTNLLKRKTNIKDFQAGQEPSVFVMTLKTGGFGLNLTKATYIFHMDPWWNPAAEHQASDRAHRIGQKKKVFVQRLVMYSSIEEKIMALKSKKEQLFKKIVDQGIVRKEKTILTKDDFDFLLSDT